MIVRLKEQPFIIMKKIIAAALTLSLFSSYIKPEEKIEANECHLFRDTEFSYSCDESQCTATASNMTFSGDEESMQFLKTQEGKEVMDKMLQQILIQCISGKAHCGKEAEALPAEEK